MINFLADDQRNTSNELWNNGSDYLSFMYPILVLCGVLVTIIASAIQLKIRKIPLKEFMNSIYIVIPAGVIGGSIFGKLGTNTPIYKLIFIWEPGLSIFGALFAGGAAGFVWFWYQRHHTKISIWVYADCIVPNILLGQAIGRWGNLFNHEILGRQTDISKFQWLPEWIWMRLFYFVDPSTGQKLSSLSYNEPLFLFESIATLMTWFFITFFIANLGKIISKKPWNVNPLAFPCKKWVSKNSLQDFDNTYQNIIYKVNDNGEYKLSKRQAWLKAYFVYQADSQEVKSAQSIIDNHKRSYLQALDKYKGVKLKRDNEINVIKKEMFKKRLSKKEFRLRKNNLKKDYGKILKELRWKKSRLLNFLTLNSQELYNINNKDKYCVIHSGVLCSTYVIFYSIIRFILDTSRTTYELSFKWNPVMNYLSLTGILILGFIMLICAQFIAPKKWREEGWLYEKSY
ncbi:prolipoprotein diacylglyceryl transferase family protein [Spiroplasma apis]|uniref:Prolipoprotein diacylglyceryl transferase n=1 Tax=Spiroplasma apis B31 TaxID=1276258 RepID=V5RIH5_SPIAP|nr:prolipoprotein diacylglyceryl transferase family protein [Spiroplasma apis]AHB35911.1 prolipoprotein diacylglyceryl transferase [Spiroplasma apis B31]